MKKVLSADWLRYMKFSGNSVQRSSKKLRLKDVKISLYIIVLILRGCFKLFLHLVRALCFYIIMIGYLVLF